MVGLFPTVSCLDARAFGRVWLHSQNCPAKLPSPTPKRPKLPRERAKSRGDAGGVCPAHTNEPLPSEVGESPICLGGCSRMLISRAHSLIKPLALVSGFGQGIN